MAASFFLEFLVAIMPLVWRTHKNGLYASEFGSLNESSGYIERSALHVLTV